MKKLELGITLIIGLFVVASIAFLSPVYASSAIGLNLNDGALSSDVAPVIENGRTLVPVRVITENLNCTVDWDALTQTVTITDSNGDKLEIVIGATSAKKIGTVENTVAMDVPAKIVNGRVMVPIRLVADNLSTPLKVGWNANSKQVCLYTEKYLDENNIDDVDFHVAHSSFINSPTVDPNYDPSKIKNYGTCTIQKYDFNGRISNNYSMGLYSYDGSVYIDVNDFDALNLRSYTIPYATTYQLYQGTVYNYSFGSYTAKSDGEDTEMGIGNATLTQVKDIERCEYTAGSRLVKYTYGDLLEVAVWLDIDYADNVDSDLLKYAKKAVDANADQIYEASGIRFTSSNMQEAEGVTASYRHTYLALPEKSEKMNEFKLSKPVILLPSLSGYSNNYLVAVESVLPSEYGFAFDKTTLNLCLVPTSYLTSAKRTAESYLNANKPVTPSTTTTPSTSTKHSTTTSFKAGDMVYRVGLWGAYGMVMSINGGQVQVHWTHVIDSIYLTDLTNVFLAKDALTRSTIESMCHFKLGGTTWIDSSELKMSSKVFN